MADCFEVPNARTVLHTFSRAFWLNMQRFLYISAVFFVILLAVYYFYTPEEYRGTALASWFWWKGAVEYAATYSGIWMAFCFAVTFLRLRRRKSTGTPVVFGYDEEAFYSTNPYYQSRIRWEAFLSVRETKNAFLLPEGQMTYAFYKDGRSEEELAEIRRIIKAKVGKTRLPSA